MEIPKATIPVLIKVTDGLNENQRIPAIELASIVAMLWKAVYVPIAVAVSFLSEMLDIHAFAMPSVDAE